MMRYILSLLLITIFTQSYAHDFLYVPWRRSYPVKDVTQKRACVLCLASQDKSQIIKSFSHVMVIINKGPYVPGHVLVITNRHVDSLDQLSKEELAQYMYVLAEIPKIFKKIFNVTSCNIGFNIGLNAGGTVPEHLHAHVVPRTACDTGFITVTTGTQIFADSFERINDELRKSMFDVQL